MELIKSDTKNLKSSLEETQYIELLAYLVLQGHSSKKCGNIRAKHLDDLICEQTEKAGRMVKKGLRFQWARPDK